MKPKKIAKRAKIDKGIKTFKFSECIFTYAVLFALGTVKNTKFINLTL